MRQIWVMTVTPIVFLAILIGFVPGAGLGARVTIKTGERLISILFGYAPASFGAVFIVSEIIGLVG